MDGWIHRRNINIINFMVNCFLSSKFIESIDGSSFIKYDKKTFKLLNRFIEQIRENNIVQIITDNESNYMLASK